MIFGIPRKSVENLFRDINFFKMPLGESYSKNHSQSKKEFQKILDFTQWKSALANPPQSLSKDEQDELDRLRRKQEASFSDPEIVLT